MPELIKDVIILPEPSPAGVRWVMMNLFTRTSLAVSVEALRAFQSLSAGNTDSSVDTKSQSYEVWDIECFSNSEGLLADPTRYKRDTQNWGPARKLSLDELTRELKKHYLLLPDESNYIQKFQRKKTLLDTQHFGNYHDQIGTHLCLEKRLNPSDWWVTQKFDLANYKVREDSLYSSVQAAYLRNYFPKIIQTKQSVLDVGCGIGYYANEMAKLGAKVLGIDPSVQYIDIARKHAPANATFKAMSIGKKGDLDNIPDESMDLIFMSDALLFYFVPVSVKDETDPHTLLTDLRRILKKTGKMVSLESHPFFYQAPWLGDSIRPYTVKTEYHHHRYGITPTLSELIQSFNQSGFAVSWMDELYPENTFAQVNEKAYAFASEFPLWLLLELKKS